MSTEKRHKAKRPGIHRGALPTGYAQSLDTIPGLDRDMSRLIRWAMAEYAEDLDILAKS